MKTKMKYRDMFEVETAINKKCRTKHWPLIKLLDKNLAKIREHADPVRERLKPTDAIKKFQAAHAKTMGRLAGQPQEEIEAASKKLIAENSQAQEDRENLQALEAEILEDMVEIEWEPISEALLHDGNNLRIESEAFLVLSKRGILTEEKPKKTTKGKKNRR